MSTRFLRSPVAIALAALVLALNVATGSLVRAPGPQLRNRFGLGAESLILGHDLPTLITSVVIANGPAELVVVLAGILLVVGAVERRIGHGRAALAYVVTAVAGGGLGTVAQAAGLLTRGVWSTPPADLVAFHPFTPIIGTAMVGSAFVGPLWRRRIRVLGFAGLIVVLLYSGQAGDVYRLAGAVVGLALGRLLARDQPTLKWPRSSHHEVRSLLAVVVAIDAAGPLVAVFQRTGYGILRPLGLLFGDPSPPAAQLRRSCARVLRAAGCGHPDPLTVLGTVTLDVLPLVVLLAAAAGLWYGRRAAAWAAVLVNVVLGLLAGVYYNLLPALAHPDEFASLSGTSDPSLQTLLAALLPLAVAVAVGADLRHFAVRSTRRAFRLTLAVVLAVTIGGGVLYTLLGVTTPNAFSPQLTSADLVPSLLQRYVPIGFLHGRRLDFMAVGAPARLLSTWIGPAAWLTLLLMVIVCCASVRRPRSVAEEARVRQLLLTGSSGSISYMAVWPGNRFWFSDDGRHVVAYRETSGVALTLGEPIGPPDGAIDAGRAFAIACDDRAVTPAFYAVRPAFADAIGDVGLPWSSTTIGEDTVLNPATFSMKGRRWQDVRSSINRADRLGLRAVWTDWDALTTVSRAQIEAISEEWIADRRLPELGFTLGGVRELRDPAVKLMLAVGPDGRVEAVTSWLPSWRDGTSIGITLDFMRRRTNSMNGVMEFLIASVVMGAQRSGLEFVSLSVAPLTRSGTTGEPNGVEQLLDRIGRMLEPAYGFASLAAFKNKFDPTSVPVVLAYPDAVSLPAISVALTRAYLPDGGLRGVARLLGTLRPDRPGAPAAPDPGPIPQRPASAPPPGDG